MISKKVYITPDAFFAFIDRTHPQHVHASSFFRYFAKEHYQLYTSLNSINDTYNRIFNKISPTLAKDFLRAMYLSSINVIYPEASEMKAAINTLVTSTSEGVTFSKSLTAIICNKNAIPAICTFEYLPSLFGLQTFYFPTNDIKI